MQTNKIFQIMNRVLKRRFSTNVAFQRNHQIRSLYFDNKSDFDDAIYGDGVH